MADPGNGRAENALIEVARVPPISFWEKAAFLGLPAAVALWAAPWLGLVVLLIGQSIFLLLHLDLIRQYVSSLASLLATILVISAFLAYPVSVFRKMARRKRVTGSSFPSGEQLVAFRIRMKKPSMWRRALVPGFFALVATAWTREMVQTAPHHHFVLAWSFPALMWLIAFLFAVEILLPRPERLWVAIGISGAFATLAAVYVVAAPHALRWRIGFWVFPLLTGGIAIAVAILMIRDWRQRRGRALAASAEP